MKSCKYFYSKKRILVVEDVTIDMTSYFNNKNVTSIWIEIEAKK